MPRVLLLLPATTYRASDFLDAARRLGVDVTVASDEPSTLETLNPEGLLSFDFRDPEEAARRAVAFAARFPVDAVLGVDDDSTVAAAAVARALDLPQNSVAAARAAVHKATMRELLSKANVPQPGFRLFRLDDAPASAAREVAYPCVLKPTFLAASRGVIRANGEEEFLEAWKRIEAILSDRDVAKKGGEWSREILVEDYLAGPEVALEGLRKDGELSTLALFDKPDPLEGPFFEETIYITPSRLPEETQGEIASLAARGCLALGLTRGPVHAEIRLTQKGPALLEIAGRSIGGLCSRMLRFGTGMSLEELLLKDALGIDVTSQRRESPAAGALMIPIPAAGVLEEIRGIEDARAVPGVEEVTISAHLGQRLVPLPEGSRYLGFVFSRADTPEHAEAALREAHRRLAFRIRA